MNTQKNPTSYVSPFVYETLYKTYKYATILLALLTCALGASVFILFSEESGNYLTSSSLTVVFYVLLCIDVIFAISASFLFKRADGISCESKIARYTNLVPAAAATYCLVTLSTSTERSILDILLIITAAFTVLFCVSKTAKLPDALSIGAGYGQILFCVLIVVKFYLDLSVEINAPAKLLLQFSAILAAFSTLSDIRCILGRSNAAQFVFSKTLVACLSPVAFVAVLTLPKASTGELRDYLCYAVFLLTYAICEISSLLLATVKYPEGYYEYLDSLYVPADEEEHE